MVSKTVAAAAVAGAAFVSYCVYFDKKRRSDPDFRKKLQERKYGFELLREFRFIISSMCQGEEKPEN